jgi:hypothetical protein
MQDSNQLLWQQFMLGICKDVFWEHVKVTLHEFCGKKKHGVFSKFILVCDFNSFAAYMMC